jgi:hypothetical protein
MMWCYFPNSCSPPVETLIIGQQYLVLIKGSKT